MRWTLRWTIFLAFLALSVALTIVFWPNGAFLFLLFPFVFPRPSRSRPASRACPTCGWTAASPDDRFCPRDGTMLPA